MNKIFRFLTGRQERERERGARAAKVAGIISGIPSLSVEEGDKSGDGYGDGRESHFAR